MLRCCRHAWLLIFQIQKYLCISRLSCMHAHPNIHTHTHTKLRPSSVSQSLNRTLEPTAARAPCMPLWHHFGRHCSWSSDLLADRQTSRRTDRQTNRQTDRLTDSQMATATAAAALKNSICPYEGPHSASMSLGAKYCHLVPY